MRREAWALAVAAFLVLLLVAPHARAMSTSLSFTLCEKANIDFTTGKAWTDDALINHIRNVMWTSTFVGTFDGGAAFTGKGSGLLSWNLDTTSGTGDLFGAFSWTFFGFRGAGDVTFSGRFSGAIAPEGLSNDLVAHEGVMTLTGHAPAGSVVCDQGAEPWTGTILMPQG